ncbi:MAG TPA: hypothetical protein VFA20_09695 [Myxococcaceae bacterium]|nr:hypothetical protein [Myxococcaceae bacterium]
MARLQQRDDELYRKYQAHIQQRRYAPPKVERVFDLDVVLE